MKKPFPIVVASTGCEGLCIVMLLLQNHKVYAVDIIKS